MTEETLPDVTAAREALAKYRGSKIKTGSGEELADALEDLLAVVDRLTAPPSEEEVEALRSVIAPLLAPYVSSPLDPIDVEIAAAIVAASGRRHLPTEPDEREWGLISPDAHPGQYGRDDRAHLVSRNREHIERQHRRGHPSIMLAHRRPAGPWEVCDEQ